MFSTHRRTALRLRAAVALAWLIGTLLLVSTPVLSNTGHSTPSTLNEHEDQVTHSDALQRILNDSGILPQLSDLSPIIIAESRQPWQDCETSDAQLESWIIDAFAADKITQIASSKLQDSLDETTFTKILQWLDSASGQTIIQAERMSATLSEEDFERHISELAASPAFQTERAPRIRSLVSTIRAGNFVSVLNTEINGIVSLSSACSPDNDTIRQALSTANDERQDLSFVSVLMNINLMPPTAAVYRQVENDVIDDYLAFSNSQAGKAYHEALINVTRDTLVNRLEALAYRLVPTQ